MGKTITGFIIATATWHAVCLFIIVVCGSFFGQQHLRNIKGQCSPAFLCADPRQGGYSGGQVICSTFKPLYSGASMNVYVGKPIVVINSTECWLDYPAARFTDPMDQLRSFLTIMIPIYAGGSVVLLLIHAACDCKRASTCRLYVAAGIALGTTGLGAFTVFILGCMYADLSQGMCTDYGFNWGNTGSGPYWNVKFWTNWQTKFAVNTQQSIVYQSLMPPLPAVCWQDSSDDVTFLDPILSFRYLALVLANLYALAALLALPTLVYRCCICLGQMTCHRRDYPSPVVSIVSIRVV